MLCVITFAVWQFKGIKKIIYIDWLNWIEIEFKLVKIWKRPIPKTIKTPNLQLNASTNESTTTALIYSPMNSPPSCKRPMTFFKYVLSLIIPSLQAHLQWPQTVRQSPWCQWWWSCHSPGSLSPLCSVSLRRRSSCQYRQSTKQSLRFKPVLSIFIPKCSKKWSFQYQF